MTIICYRDGVMASDSLVTDGDARAGTIEKLSINRKKWMAGAAGAIHPCQEFHAWVMAGCDGEFDPSCDDGEFSGILVSPSGVIYDVDADGKRSRIKAEYVVCGSGSSYALGAMAFGATAVEAVQVAIKLCVTCGGDLQVITRKKR